MVGEYCDSVGEALGGIMGTRVTWVSKVKIFKRVQTGRVRCRSIGLKEGSLIKIFLRGSLESQKKFLRESVFKV